MNFIESSFEFSKIDFEDYFLKTKVCTKTFQNFLTERPLVD